METEEVKVDVNVTEVDKVEVDKEKQVHIDLADARVAAVKAKIAAAQAARDDAEKNGVMETPGAKLDREAKEKADLEAAAKVNVVESLILESSNVEVKTLSDKLNEVIAYLNKSA